MTRRWYALWQVIQRSSTHNTSTGIFVQAKYCTCICQPLQRASDSCQFGWCFLLNFVLCDVWDDRVMKIDRWDLPGNLKVWLAFTLIFLCRRESLPLGRASGSRPSLCFKANGSRIPMSHERKLKTLTVPGCKFTPAINLPRQKSMFIWSDLNSLSLICQNKNLLCELCCQIWVFWAELWLCCAETRTWRPICQGRQNVVSLRFGFTSVIDC